MGTRAGAAAGGMSCPAEVGREDLSPFCGRVLVRGNLVAFSPGSHSDAEHAFPCAHTHVRTHACAHARPATQGKAGRARRPQKLARARAAQACLSSPADQD